MNANRVAVVTGGTGALGHVVVGALVEDGWTVHVPWVDRGQAQALEASHGSSKRLHLAEANLARASDVERLFADVDARSGRLDALLALAGGFGMAPIDDGGVDLWEQMIAINATSAFLACRAAVPRLKRAGGGRIVTMASAAALVPRAGMSAYVAAKAAVVALTRSLAKELARDHITVNAIAPTTIDTAAGRAASPNADRSGWVSPEQIAGTIRWLLGDGASTVSGTVIEMGR